MSDKSSNQNEEKLEAIAKVRMLKTSPQKLNLVSKMIRNKPVNIALAQLKFSRKRIALDVKKCCSEIKSFELKSIFGDQYNLESPVSTLY